MGYTESDQPLLQRGSKDSALEERGLFGAVNNGRHRSHTLKGPVITMTASAVLAISLMSNVVLFLQYHSVQSQIHLCVSEYTGLGLTTEGAYWQHTEYLNENRSISDQLWDAIDTSPNTIALDKDYITEHNISPSIPFPWDQTKGLYLIKAFHHMHCLKNIRKAYVDALDSHPGESQLIPQEHALHCLDIMRQDIMCRPDDTPMPSIQQRHKWGDGQVRKCKDWDALIKWTQHPSRHACFRMLSDYRRVPHSLEQFAFCLEDSPYTEVMEEYFAEHGHRDPYREEDMKADPGTEGY